LTFIDPKGRFFANQDEHVAMTIWRSAAGLLSQTMDATRLSLWILALAIMGVGLVLLTAIPHVRGATAPIVQIRSGPITRPTMQSSAESVHAAAGLSGAQWSSPALSRGKFRERVSRIPG
jgi:hypothetical protein